MIMTCPPLAHAKVGWPGEFWPSPYISVNWAFNVTRSPGGKWMLRFPFNHGEWVADVDFDPVYADRWRISWWNGRCHCSTHKMLENDLKLTGDFKGLRRLGCLQRRFQLRSRLSHLPE